MDGGTPGSGFWQNLWKLTALLNIFVCVLAVLWFGKRLLTYDGEIKAADLIVIVLAAVTVVLAALAIALGGLAIWGFAEIKRAAEVAAKKVAAEVAADVAAPVAAREALDLQETLQDGAGPPSSEDTDPLSRFFSR
jgi:hypothetical protein